MSKIILFKQSVNCPPCSVLAAVLQEDLMLQPDITVDLSNPTDDELELVSSVGVMSTPTMVLVDDDMKEIVRLQGVPQRQSIIDLFANR